MDRNIHKDAEGLDVSEGGLQIPFIGISYVRVYETKRGAVYATTGDSTQQGNCPPRYNRMRATGDQTHILHQVSFVVPRRRELLRLFSHTAPKEMGRRIRTRNLFGGRQRNILGEQACRVGRRATDDNQVVQGKILGEPLRR